MTVAAKPAARPFAAAINHLLARESWARERLSPHAGHTAQLTVTPITLHLQVTEDGYVRALDEAPMQSPSNVRIEVPLTALGDFATGGQAAVMKHVKIEGDAEFANTISYLAQHLRWEIAEDLSRLIGDTAAHRLTETARAAAEHAKRTGKTAAESLVDYLVEENPQLVRRPELNEFSAQVTCMRDDLARLEKRIERLTRDTPARAPSRLRWPGEEQ